MTAAKEKTEIMKIQEIKNILPHRYPFLLVDKVIEMDVEAGTIHAVKNVTANEEFFNGHFPNKPIMPGVLIIEALAQAGGILVYQKGFTDKISVLLSIKSAKFRRPVHPGDVLHLHCDGIHFGSKAGKVKAQAFVDGQLAVEAELGFALVDEKQL